MLPRLTDGQVQEIGKLRHTARLLLASFPRKSRLLHGVLSDTVPSEQIDEMGSADESQWLSGSELLRARPNSAVVTRIPLVAPSCSIVP